jgi:uncharacterized protein (TIGR03084 family)
MRRVVDVARLVGDLSDERKSLDSLVRALDEPAWLRPTPAEGWTIRDQISHLAFEDELARTAVSEPEAFAPLRRAEQEDPEGFTERGPARGRAMTRSQVLSWWRAAGPPLFAALRRLSADDRVGWFGPSMSAASFVTARLMETWAHGQDVADALGVARQPTDRLRSIAHLGVAARRYSYLNNGLSPPPEPVRVELRAPGGDLWTWGGAATNRVTGDALDFCLVVTRRRHVADTNLLVEGARAEEWMSIAQAYAGPPGPGRRPGQFPRPQA